MWSCRWPANQSNDVNSCEASAGINGNHGKLRQISPKHVQSNKQSLWSKEVAVFGGRQGRLDLLLNVLDSRDHWKNLKQCFPVKIVARIVLYKLLVQHHNTSTVKIQICTEVEVSWFLAYGLGYWHHVCCVVSKRNSVWGFLMGECMGTQSPWIIYPCSRCEAPVSWPPATH